MLLLSVNYMLTVLFIFHSGFFLFFSCSWKTISCSSPLHSASYFSILMPSLSSLLIHEALFSPSKVASLWNSSHFKCPQGKMVLELLLKVTATILRKSALLSTSTDFRSPCVHDKITHLWHVFIQTQRASCLCLTLPLPCLVILLQTHTCAVKKSFTEWNDPEVTTWRCDRSYWNSLNAQESCLNASFLSSFYIGNTEPPLQEKRRLRRPTMPCSSNI